MKSEVTKIDSHPVNVIGNRIHIGTSNFAEIIQENALYADKSLLIKDIIDDTDKTLLITRPRRWGKTLNMSMLQHFFASCVRNQNTAELFDNLLIKSIDNGKYMQYQGKHPVIFISFKDVKDNSLADTVYNIGGLINDLYREHAYLLKSVSISAADKTTYNEYRKRDLKQNDVEKGLKFLSELLSQHYSQKVYILIDEYDTPLNEAYSAEYFPELVKFMRNLFSNAMKDNPYLEKGIMTGILRVSKDSMLSGLNNQKVYTVLKAKYREYFGFTNGELDLLFKNQGLEQDEAAVKAWYNGYSIGGLTIYNPWSILNCLSENGSIEPYWLNTGDDSLIKLVIQNSSKETKEKLQELMLGKSIEDLVNESVRFENLENDPNAIWSMLLYTGYLTAISYEVQGKYYKCKLLIPNKEIEVLYTDIFIDWLGRDMLYSGNLSKALLNHLVIGEIEKAATEISRLLLAVASFRDYAKQPEAFYHGFMLALTAALLDDYYIYSNKESGYGYPDLLFIPKQHRSKQQSATNGVILEFKHVNANEDAKQIAQMAVDQINTKDYAAAFSEHKQVSNILKVGLAFDGKSVTSAHEKVKL